MMSEHFMFLDCIFCDGGYYNAWDFSPELIHQYLEGNPPIFNSTSQ